MRTIETVNLSGKRVLMRLDLNVPMDGLEIADANRIRAALPTIEQTLAAGATQVCILTHLGQPKGEPVEALRVDPIAAELDSALDVDVAKLADCIDVEMPSEPVVLLENVRFHPEEEAENDAVREAHARRIIEGCGAQVFICDAFGTVHRKHASVYDIPRLMANLAAAGPLIVREVAAVESITKTPVAPLVVVLGGAKVSDKMGVIRSLYSKASHFLIGGKMALAFLKAHGHYVGAVEEEDDEEKAKAWAADVARATTLQAEDVDGKLVLPVDVRISRTFSPKARTENVPVDRIRKHYVAPDIGEDTEVMFRSHLRAARTVLHSGPMGVFEFENYAHGTRDVLCTLAALDGTTVVGGGDTIASVAAAELTGQFTHESTGGSALLKMFAGDPLPGLDVLGYR